MRLVVLTASHISAEMTSRTVRAPSRARPMQAMTDVGLSGSRVSARRTSSRRAGPAPRGAPMIASIELQSSVTPAGSSGLPCSEDWKMPSSMRAVCSARARLRPSQNSSWAIRASTYCCCCCCWPTHGPA